MIFSVVVNASLLGSEESGSASGGTSKPEDQLKTQSEVTGVTDLMRSCYKEDSILNPDAVHKLLEDKSTDAYATDSQGRSALNYALQAFAEAKRKRLNFSMDSLPSCHDLIPESAALTIIHKLIFIDVSMKKSKIPKDQEYVNYYTYSIRQTYLDLLKKHDLTVN